MNLISIEAQLFILAVLFYIYDSSLLLFDNEGVITPAWKNWTAKTYDKGLLLLRKRLCIPNLLIPHRPIFRLSWNPEKIEPSPAIQWQKEKALYRWFALPTYGMATALFLITPITYYFFRSDSTLLICLALIYYFPIATGILLYQYKGQLGLSNKAAWALFFECLFCPPFTINIVRKLSRARSLPANFVATAFQLLNAEQWLVLRTELIAYLDSETEETDSTQRISRLSESKETLLRMNK